MYAEWHDWREIADGGFIRNHNTEGNTLYGIEIMVDPEYRGMRLARRLYDARKKLAREKNLMRIVLGGRIPGFVGAAPATVPTASEMKASRARGSRPSRIWPACCAMN